MLLKSGISNIRVRWFGRNANNLKYWWNKQWKILRLRTNGCTLISDRCCCWRCWKESPKKKNGYNFWYSRKSVWAIHIPVNLPAEWIFQIGWASTCLFSLRRKSSSNSLLVCWFSFTQSLSGSVYSTFMTCTVNDWTQNALCKPTNRKLSNNRGERERDACRKPLRQ